MLITEEVEIGLKPQTIKYYEDLGYIIPREKDKWDRLRVPRGTKIIVKVKDLSICSKAEIKIKCDGFCNKTIPAKYADYKKCVHSDGKYYCHSCAHKLFAGESIRKASLKKSITFEEWCYINLEESEAKILLSRWNYDLNIYKPNEISFSSCKKMWFNCERGIHKPELKDIHNFTRNGETKRMSCNVCDSFGQYLVDTYGKDAFEKYWDYEKNIGIDAWSFGKSTDKQKVWIKCQNPDKQYHGSFEVNCNNFTLHKSKCPYCDNHKTHPLDSLGTLFPQVLEIWSDKNEKSPYEYSPSSSQEVWWKCPDGKHEDFQRVIHKSKRFGFRCPECSVVSVGELKITEYLINNNIPYIPQQSFKELLGINKGTLSYDFNITNRNIFIEYQGIQHFEPVEYFGGEKAFRKQLLNDKIKREYCIRNDIKLLEISYLNYDNIESILDKQLNISVQEAI